MASENETVADIVAMLRRFAKGEELPTDEIPSFTSLADRFEAANRREVAELKKAYDRAVSADARHAIENESLLHCLKVAEDALTVVFKNTAYGERFFSTTCEFVHEKAKNALAAIKKDGGAK